MSGSRTRVAFPCRSRDSRGARWQREEIKRVRWSHLTPLIPGLLSLGWQRQTPRCPIFVFEVREEMTAGTTVPPWEARAAAGERNQKERLGFSATPLLTGSLGGGKLVAFMLLYNKINYSKPRGSSLGGEGSGGSNSGSSPHFGKCFLKDVQAGLPLLQIV